MTSAKLDSFVGNVLNHDYTFFLITGSLQNQVVTLGFLNGKKLLMGTSNINDHGELSLADLALELLEIIVLGTPDDLFLDFEMNPLSQTFQVYCSA